MEVSIRGHMNNYIHIHATQIEEICGSACGAYRHEANPPLTGQQQKRH